MYFKNTSILVDGKFEDRMRVSWLQVDLGRVAQVTEVHLFGFLRTWDSVEVRVAGELDALKT